VPAEEAGELHSRYAESIEKKITAYANLHRRLEAAKSKNGMSPLDRVMLLVFNTEMYDERLMTEKMAKQDEYLKSPLSPIHQHAEDLEAYANLVKDRFRVSKDIRKQYEAYSVERFMGQEKVSSSFLCVLLCPSSPSLIMT